MTTQLKQARDAFEACICKPDKERPEEIIIYGFLYKDEIDTIRTLLDRAIEQEAQGDALRTISNQLQYWLDWDKDANKDDDAFVIPPSWPRRSVIKNWIQALSAYATIAGKE
jgi:hypothetical protein